MASGNLSPRQKMINMMYLVLTALLALNVSREVMDAFFEVDQEQTKHIKNLEDQNKNVYDNFDAAYASNATKVGPYRDKAFQVRSEAANLNSLIAEMKAELIERSGGIDETWEGEGEKPKKMDDREVSPNYFLIEQNGAKLRSAMEAYRDFLIAQVPSKAKDLNETFDFSDRVHDGASVSWESSKFEHYPLISVITSLTMMQNDVRTSEASIIAEIERKITADDIKVTGVKPIVIPKSTFVTQGDKYEAQVLLAAYDDTQDPTFIINGEEVAAEDIINGVANISLPATGIGTKKWNGEIRLITNGETETYTLDEQTYNVAPPSVVISPTKMNVLYRGVDNPLEISVPGVDPANLIVNGPGVKKSGQGYIADVTRNTGNTMKISVSVRQEDGTTKSMKPKEFRVKSLPAAYGQILGQNDGVRSAGFIKNNEVKAVFKDFDFDLDLKVKSFEIVIPPFAPIQFRVNRLSSEEKATLDKAKPGNTIIIRRIKATTNKGLSPTVNDMIFDLN